ANTGGKSTFLRSVGLAHVMMQAGMFVSAESFASEPCDGIFTHYKREEDAAMESGKLDEELSRMSLIVDKVKANSLLQFNESFGSTNERGRLRNCWPDRKGALGTQREGVFRHAFVSFRLHVLSFADRPRPHSCERKDGWT